MKTALRWVGAVLGLAVLCVLVILAWGAGLPLDHDVSCSAVIDRPAPEVYQTIADDGQSPAWRTDVVRVLRAKDPDGTTVWVETNVRGMAVHYRETEASRVDGRIVRTIEEPGLPFAGTWTYTIRPYSNVQTSVAVEETGTIYNPAFRFAERYVVGYTSTIRAYLNDLGKRFGGLAQVTCTSPTFSSPD